MEGSGLSEVAISPTFLVLMIPLRLKEEMWPFSEGGEKKVLIESNNGPIKTISSLFSDS